VVKPLPMVINAAVRLFVDFLRQLSTAE
jgi:hypothetical protein